MDGLGEMAFESSDVVWGGIDCVGVHVHSFASAWLKLVGEVSEQVPVVL